MRENDNVYGYRVQRSESKIVVGLDTFTNDFALNNNIFTPPSVKNWVKAGRKIYYNNFDLVDIPAYRNNEIVKKYTDAVWKSYIIYTHRWETHRCGTLSSTCHLMRTRILNSVTLRIPIKASTTRNASRPQVQF